MRFSNSVERVTQSTLLNLFSLMAEADNAPEESDELEDVADNEREYVRGLLKESLGREPTDEELDEWLREHTEGY